MLICSLRDGVFVPNENPQSELKRLLREQLKTLQDEVYGGLLAGERAEYNSKANRIHQLQIELQATAASDLIAEERRRDWNKTSETDTPQSSARQPYRSREKESADTFTGSKTDRKGNGKSNPKASGEGSK